jgi:hypothetical protein
MTLISIIYLVIYVAYGVYVIKPAMASFVCRKMKPRSNQSPSHTDLGFRHNLLKMPYLELVTNVQVSDLAGNGAMQGACPGPRSESSCTQSFQYEFLI